jgi:hypothetical protein
MYIPFLKPYQKPGLAFILMGPLAQTELPHEPEAPSSWAGWKPEIEGDRTILMAWAVCGDGLFSV